MPCPGCLACVSFGDISFYLQEALVVGSRRIIIPILCRQKEVVARRITCPMQTPDPKTWLVQHLRMALAGEYSVCHEDPDCSECCVAMQGINDTLASWLPPERHAEFLGCIEESDPKGIVKYPFRDEDADPRFPFSDQS